MNPKSIIKRLGWLIILVVTALTNAYIRDLFERVPTEVSKGQIDVQDLIFISLLLLALLAILFLESIERSIENLFLWVRHRYSDFVYSFVKVKIEYLNEDGTLISFARTDHITRLSVRRNKRIHRVPLTFDGIIRKADTGAINSSYSFPSNSSIVFHCYFDDKKVVNREHFSTYSLIVEDAFKEKSEYWYFAVKNYCKYYEVEIQIPIGRAVREVKLMLLEGGNDLPPNAMLKTEDFVLVKDPSISVTQAKMHTRIIAQITGLKTADLYKIMWTLS